MTALAVIQLISQVAAESNLAVGAIFALIQGVRNAWPKSEKEPLPTDEELIAAMKAAFKKNAERNQALIDAIKAGNPA